MLIINTAVMRQLITDTHCQRINVCEFFDSNNLTSKNGLIINMNVGSRNINIWYYQTINTYALEFILVKLIGANV